MTPHDPRVLVTGLGLSTGLGRSREASWDALRAGRQGFRLVQPELSGEGSAPLQWAGCPAGGDLKSLIVRTALEALNDSGLGRPVAADPERVGVVIGVSKGDLRLLGKCREALRQFGPGCEWVASWAYAWPNQWPAKLAQVLGLRGPLLTPVAACATGLIAALRGADLIRRGECDVVLVGAADQSLTPLILGAFQRMGVFPRFGPGDDLGRLVRPWDRDRSGFLVGEGAAVLVLEREDHARARGALPYAELAGGSYGSDAYHLTDLNPDPSGLAHVIRTALERSGVDPSEVDHVNVHGTATRANDPLECQALRLALRGHAGRVACSANKAQVGHCLGAAGAVELAFTCLAVRDGFIPPTLNLERPDPLCDLDGTPHVGRAREVRAALKLSLGFGGHLAAAVLRQCEEPRRAPVPLGDGGEPDDAD